MNSTVLFGVAHSMNHNKTWFVRGLFEVENQFFFFSPEDFRVSARDNPDLFWPNVGDVLAFLIIPNETPYIYDEMPGVEQTRMTDILGVWEKTSLPLPKGLLTEKHQSDLLIEAVKNSDEVNVKTLLNDGADPNSTDSKGNFALLHAVGKNKEVAAALIAFGADPDRTNLAGVSPFSFANENHQGFLLILNRAQLQLLTISWLNAMRHATE